QSRHQEGVPHSRSPSCFLLLVLAHFATLVSHKGSAHHRCGARSPVPNGAPPQVKIAGKHLSASQQVFTNPVRSTAHTAQKKSSLKESCHPYTPQRRRH